MPAEIPDWPKLLSLAVHEFRTPTTVVGGYLRMLLKERAGRLADAQRKLIEEAEKSCGRLSGLLSDMSDLAHLQDGRAMLDQDELDLSGLLDRLAGETVVAEGEAGIRVTGTAGPLRVRADKTRLPGALAAIAHALRREIIDGGDLVISKSTREAEGKRVAWIAFGPALVTDALEHANPSALGPFDDTRGGCGLSLPLARVVIDLHGGRLLALPGARQKAGGVVQLPLA